LIVGRSGEDPACRGSCGDNVGCNPGNCALALARTAPTAARMAATKTAASAVACRLRRAPHRRPGLLVGVSISKEGRQKQEQTGWWRGTSGNGARRGRSVSWAVINDPSDTSKAVVRHCTVHSLWHGGPTVPPAVRSCLRHVPAVPATQSATRAAEDTLRRKVSPTRPVRWAVKVPPRAARSFGCVGAGTTENPSRAAKVVYATRPSAPAGV